MRKEEFVDYFMDVSQFDWRYLNSYKNSSQNIIFRTEIRNTD